MESNSLHGKVSFRVLQTRLIKAVNGRIQNGDFTERGLARLLGISQPQIHNVLKGARKLRPELADRLISLLEMTVADLLETPELREQLARRGDDPHQALYPEARAGFPVPSRHWTNAKLTKKPPSGHTRRIRSGEEQAS